ncbi:unnamed protein product [Parnassius mnemosyne]|uniref:Nucleic-acid-binding protein from mobile element jockey n=1 Tax=Parnassius mnemosyne TaxID=213953 RepID=A0AAV1LVU8_9NEOP
MTDENEEFNNNIIYNQDDITELEVEERDSIDINTPRIIKRIRETEESDEEWSIVKGKGKKKRLLEDENLRRETDIEVYITCIEKLPKQFALARLFKENGITDIIRVKYLNPFKVRLQLPNEESVKKLSTCATFISMGWRIQKAMEVNYSYGIIRDVELEISEEEIMKNISCSDSTELISVKRLMRRSNTKQEALCIYPVTQCSQCWRLGHIRKLCPFKKTICPKCGGGHENCDTKTFKCINCSGAHMALARSCPAYLKERKLRELMAEFNCTYRRALTIYVAPTPHRDMDVKLTGHNNIQQEMYNYNTPKREAATTQNVPTFAEVTANVIVHNEDNISQCESNVSSSRRHQTKKEKRNTERDTSLQSNRFEPNTSYSEENNNKSSGKISFSELLVRLKEVIFFNNFSLQEKVYKVIKLGVEWLILVTVDNISEWPMLKTVLNLFNG